MAVQFILDRDFLSEVEKASEVALRKAGARYLSEMAEVLTNRPPRTGRLYEFRKGSLRPISEAGTSELGKAIAGASVKGRTRIKRKIRVHVASAPGEPPALLTGQLRRQRGMRVAKDTTADELVAVFGSSAGPKIDGKTRAEFLEEGGEVFEARPAWGPTMQRLFPELIRIYTAEFKRRTTQRAA